ncbi:conserved protein of unknown function [Hyphomicrobium sp. 1Nfss2.1]|uniref:hypothetical protein n=1 Tax=Hyphomicrobium sp. 1Nfss2.1 TaxID=3413936 RepID=UPI003C7AA8D9
MIRFGPVSVASLLLATSAAAEIHDYMILRLLYLNTSCGVEHLERLEPDTPETRRFHAECRDVAAYPNGIDVVCADVLDDRSCKVETTPKNFDNLELLSPRTE